MINSIYFAANRVCLKVDGIHSGHAANCMRHTFRATERFNQILFARRQSALTFFIYAALVRSWHFIVAPSDRRVTATARQYVSRPVLNCHLITTLRKRSAALSANLKETSRRPSILLFNDREESHTIGRERRTKRVRWLSLDASTVSPNESRLFFFFVHRDRRITLSPI